MSEESFEKLLEENDVRTIRNGDVVDGYVIAVTNNEVKVDLGNKCTGTIKIEDVTDDPQATLEDRFKVGDKVSAIAVRVSDVDGIIVLNTKKIEAINSWNSVKEAVDNNTTLEGKVIEANKGGVVVRVNSQRVFVPASQTGIPKGGDLGELLKKTVQLRLNEVNAARRRVVGSIKDVTRELRKAAQEKVWSEIEVGKHYKGVVKSLTSYGAFVDIGGVDGMVHVSELSWNRIKNPSEVVKVGDEIDVFVLALDPDKKKISLGYKTPESNPWVQFEENYHVGDVVKVKIVKLMDFGAFAEIIPGVDGLIHISRIADHRIGKPDEVLSVGEEVDVKIVDIDAEHKRISLSIRALIEPTEEPATEEAAEEAAEEAPVEAPAEEAPVEAPAEAPAEEAKDE